ncbi:insulinase family protein [Pseudomonas caspiana]
MASTPILDWLPFFRTNWPTLRDEYNRLSQRGLDASSPLDLAHHHARSMPLGLSELGAVALVALLTQLQPEDQVPTLDWQLPKPNPFLGAVSNGDEGAVYLRWQLQCPQPALWQRFEHRLHPLISDAKQAGADLALTAYGNYWQLKLSGIAAPIPDILEHAFGLLNGPANEALGQSNAEPALIPIRQLLKVLPDRYLDAEEGAPTTEVENFWASTRWISFATGLSVPVTVMNKTPGHKDTQPAPIKTLLAGKHWRGERSSSSESAVLLFCPPPTSSIADEATWRLLAQLAQGPFYQRLRVDLQLGYAVFSGLRQIAGHTGLLFGVQSPNASAQQLVEHIEAFLISLKQLVSETELSAQTAALIAQLDVGAMENASAAELLWQGHLAGRNADYLPRLRDALRQISHVDLSTAVIRLNEASGGWLCLTNTPEKPWTQP